MNTIILLSLLATMSFADEQPPVTLLADPRKQFNEEFGLPWPKPPDLEEGAVVTDSVRWVGVADSLHLGTPGCRHQWVYGDSLRASGVGCAVFHNGFHCPYDDRKRIAICRRCLRREYQREMWYQRREEAVRSEYDILKDSLNATP